MKFTVAQKSLVKMLKTVIDNPTLPKRNKDLHLRLEASGGKLILTVNESEAESAAEVLKEGVCYINYKNLLPVIRSFKGTKDLTIEVDPNGMRIGSLRISNGIWVALFDNPATAPKRHIGKEDLETLDVPQDDSIHAWRAFYSKS